MTDPRQFAMSDLASQAVERARGLLPAEHHGPVRVASCFHYGAVDIDPQHLVVWVLLTGAPDEELLEWSSPEAARLRGFDPALVAWMEHLRRIVRDAFAAVQWPEAKYPQVLFDSERRVAQGGGWQYFK
jgi:hypothetical protein